ncbi:hypothetical protein [Pontibacter oryzae]|uniref:Uncharacterized protein n=1 Tax=Pontibacter oryzae TaxID=2304593 RepID=A0A399SCT9_9BACT|nr:hypothetical protein [Pontibacter oryzae]RIJ41540.1 hypothetical protein D1627_05755 [Pontibacter oryzae]
MRNVLLLLVLLTGLLSACNDKYKDPDPEAMGYDYFPLEVGDFRIYNVTDIRFKSNKGDTTRFQMRERVDATFYDQTNTLNYKVIRSIRVDASTPWVDDSVYTIIQNKTNLLLTKNNTKYVKMVFPVKEGKSWTADAFNDRFINVDEKERSSYTNVGEAYTAGENTYGNTVTVIQGTPSDGILILDDRKEVYAAEVGLVYRVFNKVIYCNDFNGECEFGTGYKLFGHERHETLLTHGKE